MCMPTYLQCQTCQNIMHVKFEMFASYPASTQHVTRILSPIILLSPIAQSAALQTWEQEVTGLIHGSASFPRIDDCHFDRIHSSLTAVHCFDNGYVGKQPVAWKEYCMEYWLKELQESMDRCTGVKHRAINQSITNYIEEHSCKFYFTKYF